MTRDGRPDLERELQELKDFQRRTVDHVHDRFFGADPVRRFLVADEVGLGKTLVARGVIAKTIDTLWDSVDRIDVVYICSNNQIAGQNLKKLRVGATEEIQHADRLTMLPKAIGQLQGQKVNFVSFTPGTSFNLKGSGGGRSAERVLLYWMLRDGLGDPSLRAKRWIRFFQGGSGLDSFTNQLRWFEREERAGIPEEMVTEFAVAVQRSRVDFGGGPSGVPLFEALAECAEGFNYLRKDKRASYPVSAQRYRLIGQLRHLLAEASVARLEPDLVILDEFQRFKDLMDEKSETAELAHALWNHADAKLLLLSATPFKMYTLPDDQEGDDHYEDFRKTVDFLAGSSRSAAVASSAGAMRTALYAGDVDAARQARDRVQVELRRVMVRTERLAATPDRDGMIVTKELPGVDVAPRDVRAYVSDAAVGSLLKGADVLEYWRSSPYLFELMDAYQVKKRLEAAAERRNQPLADALALAGTRLTWDEFRRYQPLDPGNAKMRGLVTDVVDRGAWRLAWIPPSLPYYSLNGPYAEPALTDFTKRLVFSSWTVVPKAIGSVLSYEVERRLIAGDGAGSPRPYDAPRTTPLLTFQMSDRRLTGMPVLGLMYPSAALAGAGDPLDVARELGARFPMDRDEYLHVVRDRVTSLLDGLPMGSRSGPVDDRWYWAAPVLLDRAIDVGLPEQELTWGWSDDEESDGRESRFYDHLALMQQTRADELGRRPDDLVEILALSAVAAPGIVALRALSTSLGMEAGWGDRRVRSASTDIAWAMRGLFNRPEVMAAVRHSGIQNEAYWQAVLRHGLDGGLQSVLDEYVHVLVESEGLVGKPIEEQTDRLSEVVNGALSLRSSTSSIHFFESRSGRVTVDRDHGLRSHFAVRFGRGTAEDSKVVQRESQVRGAYNSPFWPFVLASTSVGQEGLDFHQYSHAIIHWNLPGNPVDLEQREGRVHRYKGHAVRKNAAAIYGGAAAVSASRDPWATVFELAADDRPADESEVFPYWVLPGKHAIERYAPVMPLSKETHALGRLMRTVGAYRLVLGQPRQEDLLRYLGDQAEALTDLGIDLTPPTRVEAVPRRRPAPRVSARAQAALASQPPRLTGRLANPTSRRIQDALRSHPWSLASEVGAVVGLSTGTARSYLGELHYAGFIEVQEDLTVRNPHGGGATRYRWLEFPRPTAAPTELMLCDACASELYGDPGRYHSAITEAGWERQWAVIDAMDDDDPPPLCQRCGRPTDDYS